MGIIRQDEGIVQAEGDLHVSGADELRAALLGELAVAPSLVLDLSGVKSCDAASLQLLCSLRESARRDCKRLHFAAPSAAICEASAILGLSLEDLKQVPKS
jgi:anti-anti-sigma factor